MPRVGGFQILTKTIRGVGDTRPGEQGNTAMRMPRACILPIRHPGQPCIQAHLLARQVFPGDCDNDDEEDYRRKVAEADAAVAAVEKARQRLLERKRADSVVENSSLLEIAPRPGMRSTLSYSDAGTLTLNLPSRGFGTDSVVSGAFSLAWFSAIVPATFAGGGVPLLFMAPFWLAGGLVAKNAAVDPFISSSITVGRFAWSLKSTYGGITVKEIEGATDDLGGADVAMPVVVNGVPQWEVRLHGKMADVGLGTGLLSEEEVRYIAREINDHLRQLRAIPTDPQ
eukprot:CAMPEP_0113556886 /NCGR_PEP_ID=MMETSP0015_2-20120614/17492_1 /TAXON_ID=2838 /ORGANISM="Odontella" /LENGTH=283 /DNA_ID=CAMNT_0000458265 /DNA_START=150 /DNA_END=1001 /DNA_ORIENTATION=- /assembly_acc=CAM_ASM_000160